MTGDIGAGVRFRRLKAEPSIDSHLSEKNIAEFIIGTVSYDFIHPIHNGVLGDSVLVSSSLR